MADLSYRYSDQSVPFYFNDQGKLVQQSGKEIPSELGISRQLVNILDSNGNQISEVRFVQKTNTEGGGEGFQTLTADEVKQKVINYYNYKKTERKINELQNKTNNKEVSKAPEVQPKVTNSNKNKTNSEKDNKNNSTTENSSTGTSTDESTVSTTSTSSEGTSTTEAAKKEQGPKYDELYRYTDESGDEYDPSAFNVGVVRNVDKEGNVSYKYIDLETNDEISEADYKSRAQDYVNKYTGADVNNLDANLNALRNGYLELANTPKSNTNEDSEMQSGEAFGTNDNIILTDEILANQGLLGFHPINGKILKTKLNETYQDYLGIGLHGHEAEIVKCYRNKLFGSSFQFLDSVDKRFSSVNDYVGYEFLRNFILHSAILHIYPGMPHYQGSVDPFEWLRNLADAGQDQMSDEQTKLTDKAVQELKAKLEEEANKKIMEENKKDASVESEDEIQPGEVVSKKTIKEGQGASIAGIAAMNEDAKTQENISTKGTKSDSVKTGIVTSLFSILFKTKYQRRLFGIKYTYEQYMRYVNLMCRSLALFLNLTVMNQIIYPQGTFTNVKTKETKDAPSSVGSRFVTFDAIDWSNYRMIEDSMSYANSTLDSSLNLLGTMFGMTDNNPATIIPNLLRGASSVAARAILGGSAIGLALGSASPTGAAAYAAGNAASKLYNKQSLAQNYKNMAMGLTNSLKHWDTAYIEYEHQVNNAKSAEELRQTDDNFWNRIKNGVKTAFEYTGLEMGWVGIQLLGSAFKDIFAQYKTVQDKLESRTQSVEFMVEPFSPNEQFSNQTTQSFIKGLVDKAAGIGTEVAFITQTNAIQDSFFTSSMEKLAKAGVGLMEGMNNLASQVPLGGSFLHNLVSGALGAVTGNRFIYPDIYQSSSSQTSFNFKVNLISPYGDVYNYFMNILVPLAHLYCLVNPRLVTANSSNSPFLVRAFVPGLATCEMGIIDSMTIHKNSEGNRVSTNGLPLSVTVEFSIHELYHHNAISPWDDPLSVINNECLLDYLCNLAGIPPTYTRRKMITASLSSVLEQSLNIWSLAGNAIGDIMLGWFGTNFGTKA